MKNKTIYRSIGLVFIVLFILVGCTSNEQAHFISNKEYRSLVHSDFLKAKKLAGGRDSALFSVLKDNINQKEREALEFLFAYMPLSDLADYSGEFYLNNVRLAFAAQDTFSWGKDIPEDEFRHFVLPHRVNNENLDTARSVFFKELYPRVKNLNIEEAALEVNHWCHEKINYHATDSRTISPLGAVKTAYGRCGEESTFTVTALRSVAIPARQVYTPRWAHVDDNHAWVEVFIEGKWKYLGACEPEPELNMGWFSAPVLRAMMVHTKAFGKYSGSEDVIDRNDKYSTLNTLVNYALVKDICIKVVEDDGQGPIDSAHVEVGLYNYAEYYPLLNITTKEDGLAHLKTGMGDLRIFASKENRFSVNKISVFNTDTVIIKLNRNFGEAFTEEFENVPPVEKVPVEPAKGGVAANKLRLAQEDSIREHYISTFYNEKKAIAFAHEHGFNRGIDKILEQARGNYPQIEQFLIGLNDDQKDTGVELLKQVAKKDLHDIEALTLKDHVDNFSVIEKYRHDKELVHKYILNPRILLEQVIPYRSYLQNKFSSLSVENPEKTITSLINWIHDNVNLDKQNNYYNVAISPIGVCELKRADSKSMKLFFVATARSLGIPARLEPATLKAQYYLNDWVTVDFEDGSKISAPELLNVELRSIDNEVEPVYRVHFSLAKYVNGRFKTYNYGWGRALSDFAGTHTMEPGYYQVLTGNRQGDGTVAVRQEFINVREGVNSLDIIVPKVNKEIKEIATWNNKINTGTVKAVGWIDPGTEPGKHFLNDYKSLNPSSTEKVDLEIYCANEEAASKVREYIPDNHGVLIDTKLELLSQMNAQTNLDISELPVFIVLDGNGGVFYHTSGYNIGIMEQLIKVQNKLKNIK